MLQTLDQYHKTLKKENLTAAPDKFLFFQISFKYLRDRI